MSGGIFNSIVNTIKTIEDIANQKKQAEFERKQKEFENQLTLEQFRLMQKEFAEKQVARADSRSAFKKARDNLANLKTYQLNDVYKKIGIGTGKDDLTRYRIGPALKQKLVTNSAFNKLAGNTLVHQTQRDNINLLRKLRDKGLTAVDKNQQDKLLRTQRRENKSLQDTITRRAIERGQDPSRARFTQRLLSAQATANRNNSLFKNLASDAATRRVSATHDLQGILNNAFNQSAQIAAAKDNVNFKNTDIRNRDNLTNYQRANQLRDTNTKLHNENTLRNTQNLTQAQREVIDSRNKKRRQLADLSAHRSQTLFKY